MKRSLLALLSAMSFAIGGLAADSETPINSVPIIEDEYSVDVPVRSWREMRDQDVVRQQYDFSCGAASMATIMKYFYDVDVTENGIVQAVLKLKGIGEEAHKFEKSDFALSFADLADYGKVLGFKGIGVALDMNGLRKLQIPVILYIKIRSFEHFTVFKGISGGFVHLADPSFGNMKVKMAKFQEMFYQREDLKHPGRVLAFIPLNKAAFKPSKDFMNIPETSDYLYRYLENRIDH